jgi:hypothetical protein
MRRVDVPTLIGKTIRTIEKASVNGDDILIFVMEDGEVFSMFHEQDCCEGVWLEDIDGELSDIRGYPLIRAEESTSKENPLDKDRSDESFTWTFYRFETEHGFVNLRWYGTSNGYYSESVSLIRGLPDWYEAYCKRIMAGKEWKE